MATGGYVADYRLSNTGFRGFVQILHANDCVITGNVHAVRGHGNTINGVVMYLYGSYNVVHGDATYVLGSHNVVFGSTCKVSGSGNTFSGLMDGNEGADNRRADTAACLAAALAISQLRSRRTAAAESSPAVPAVSSSSSSSSSSAPPDRVRRRARTASASPPPAAKRAKAKVPEAVSDEPPAEAWEIQCTACTERATKTVNRPCNHAYLCVTCARRLDTGGELKCWICAAPVKRIERLYLSGERPAAVVAVSSSSDAGPARSAPVAAAVVSSSSDAAPAVSSPSSDAPVPPLRRARRAAPASPIRVDEYDELAFVVVNALRRGTHQIIVPPDCNITVLKIKQRLIDDLGGMPVAQQILARRGVALDDHKTLKDYGVSPGDVLVLHDAASTGSFLIVKTLTGGVHRINTSGRFATITVDELKQLIQDTIGMPPDQQRLIYRGIALSDDRRLCDYGVSSGEELCVVGALRGD